MKKTFPLLFLVISITGYTNAQVRYLDDIFSVSQIVKTTDVVYGQNFYFMDYPPAPAGSDSVPQIGPLQMDVYTPPVSDTAQTRPLIILVHSGSFLPKYFNGYPTGRKDDSTVVELANRFTQKGYVTSAIDYRLGWNPLASSQVERTAGIINAVYRAIHDVQTAVRFFKKDAATTNVYKIDPNRIILVGQAAGGFVTLAYNFLTEEAELSLPKFLDGLGNSVIDPNLVGYPDGIGGVVNNYNHPGYSNQIQMVANMGGGMGDISWMNNYWPGVPVACLHCRKDPFASIDSGNVIVPFTGQVVVFVHGSKTVIKKAVQQGLNDIWVNHTFIDPYSLRAYSLNPANTTEGLFQFEIPSITPSGEESDPWEWWDSTYVVNEAMAYGLTSGDGINCHLAGLAGNPNMSAARGKAYCDTVVGFLTPRMYLVVTNPSISIEPNTQIEYAIYPNPVTESLSIQLSNGIAINQIAVMDAQGKVAMLVQDIQASNYILHRNGLAPGIYFIKINTTQGNFTHKIIVN
jgi:hypothetical protein